MRPRPALLRSVSMWFSPFASFSHIGVHPHVLHLHFIRWEENDEPFFYYEHSQTEWRMAELLDLTFSCWPLFTTGRSAGAGFDTSCCRTTKTIQSPQTRRIIVVAQKYKKLDSPRRQLRIYSLFVEWKNIPCLPLICWSLPWRLEMVLKWRHLWS